MAAPVHGQVGPYSPPDWACHLTGAPSSRVQLAMRPTPVHRWSPPHPPAGYTLGIKREDMSGCSLSGNKVRKLEFLLADALERGCDSVVTFGAFQSNHARATVAAARELGLTPYVFILEFKSGDSEDGVLLLGNSGGNKLLMETAGAKFVVYKFTDKPLGEQLAHIHREMVAFVEKLSGEGHRACLIPKGGSNTLGAWGWIDAFHEMVEQGVLEDYDDVFVAAGSMGCACGLAIGNYLTGSRLKIHGVYINPPQGTDLEIYTHLDDCLRDMGITDARSCDLVHPILGYYGNGYGKSTPSKLDVISEVMSATGVTLDPDFTLKSYLGMVGTIKDNPSALKGTRVLYIHTGGVFGLFDGRMNKVIRSKLNRAS